MTYQIDRTPIRMAVKQAPYFWLARTLCNIREQLGEPANMLTALIVDLFTAWCQEAERELAIRDLEAA